MWLTEEIGQTYVCISCTQTIKVYKDCGKYQYSDKSSYFQTNNIIIINYLL